MLFFAIYLSAAATALLVRRWSRIGAAAALSPIASEHSVDYRGGTAYARLHGYRSCRTVLRARAAFHARVAVLYLHVFAVHFKYFVGADIQAHSASGAFVFI